MHPSMIRDEWDFQWERFISREHRNKIEGEGIRIQRKYGLRSSDIREYHIRQKEKKALAESQASTNAAKPETYVLFHLNFRYY